MSEDIGIDPAFKTSFGFRTTGFSDFTSASDITISDKWKNRIQTGNSIIDRFFGGDYPGFVQGTVINIAADKGSGKSTLLSQICHMFNEKNGKDTCGYIVNEESLEQCKFRFDRLGCYNISVAKFGDIQEVLGAMKSQRFRVLIIDAFSNLTAGTLYGAKAEAYNLEKLLEYSQKYSQTVFNVLHKTKGGKAKGSTNIGHAADIECHIYRGNPEAFGSSSVRILSTFGHKNRLAEETRLGFEMGGRGWELDSVVADADTIDGIKKPYAKV